MKTHFRGGWATDVARTHVRLGPACQFSSAPKVVAFDDEEPSCLRCQKLAREDAPLLALRRELARRFQEGNS